MGSLRLFFIFITMIKVSWIS